LLKELLDELLEEGLIASFIWPARGSKGGQFVTVSGSYIKEEVK
jgi:hypothetical protein